MLLFKKEIVGDDLVKISVFPEGGEDSPMVIHTKNEEPYILEAENTLQMLYVYGVDVGVIKANRDIEKALHTAIAMLEKDGATTQ